MGGLGGCEGGFGLVRSIGAGRAWIACIVCAVWIVGLRLEIGLWVRLLGAFLFDSLFREPIYHGIHLLLSVGYYKDFHYGTVGSVLQVRWAQIINYYIPLAFMGFYTSRS